MTESGPRRARSENFMPFHEGMRRLLTEGLLVHMASQPRRDCRPIQGEDQLEASGWWRLRATPGYGGLSADLALHHLSRGGG